MFISVTNPTSRSSCLNPFRSKRGKGLKKLFINSYCGKDSGFSCGKPAFY